MDSPEPLGRSKTSRILWCPIRWQGGFRSQSLHDWIQSTAEWVIPVDAVVGAEWIRNHSQSRRDVLAQRLLIRRVLTPGEIGAFLTHHRVHQQALEYDWDWLVVLEDDLSLLPDSVSRVRETLQRTPNRAILLNFQPHRPYLLKRGSKASGAVRPLGHGGGVYVEPVEVSPYSAEAYALSRKACMIAAASPDMPVTPPDWPPWSSRCLNFAATENCFGGNEGESVIDNPESPHISRTNSENLTPVWVSRLARLTLARYFVARAHYGSPTNYFRLEIIPGLVRRLRRVTEPIVKDDLRSTGLNGGLNWPCRAPTT